MNSKGMTGIAAGLMIVGTAFGQCGGMKAASGCGGEQEMAATMSAISGLRDAPPTRKPSMSSIADSSLAFFAFTEPPYWMRMPSPHSLET